MDFCLSPPFTFYQRHVPVMVADPKPNQTFFVFKCQSAIVITNFCSPPLANFLKLKGRVPWIFFEQIKFSVCKFLDSRWKSVITIPKLRFRFIDRLVSLLLYLQVFHREADQVSLLLYLLQSVYPTLRRGLLGLYEDSLLKIQGVLVG